MDHRKCLTASHLRISCALGKVDGVASLSVASPRLFLTTGNTSVYEESVFQAQKNTKLYKNHQETSHFCPARGYKRSEGILCKSAVFYGFHYVKSRILIFIGREAGLGNFSKFENVFFRRYSTAHSKLMVIFVVFIRNTTFRFCLNYYRNPYVNQCNGNHMIFNEKREFYHHF